MSVRIERPATREACVWIDRPPLNVLDLRTLRDLDEALRELEEDDELTLAILRGAGERAFSAGVDVKIHEPDTIDEMLARFHRALRRLHRLDAVTLAMIDGHCLGGGMELALACDLRVATRRSTFGQPEIRLACFAPVASILLPSQLGPARAADLLLSGRRIGAETAEAWGLVSRLGEDPEALQVALLEELRAHSRPALRLAKRALRIGRLDDTLFAEALEESELLYREELAKLEDVGEAVRAFAEKREPEWRHG